MEVLIRCLIAAIHFGQLVFVVTMALGLFFIVVNFFVELGRTR